MPTTYTISDTRACATTATSTHYTAAHDSEEPVYTAAAFFCVYFIKLLILSTDHIDRVLYWTKISCSHFALMGA